MRNFRTSDMSIAAYLIYVNQKIEGLENDNGKKIFVFRENENLNKLKHDFYELKITVEPIRYSTCLKTIKNLIHSNI